MPGASPLNDNNPDSDLVGTNTGSLDNKTRGTQSTPAAFALPKLFVPFSNPTSKNYIPAQTLGFFHGVNYSEVLTASHKPTHSIRSSMAAASTQISFTATMMKSYRDQIDYLVQSHNTYHLIKCLENFEHMKIDPVHIMQAQIDSTMIRLLKHPHPEVQHLAHRMLETWCNNELTTASPVPSASSDIAERLSRPPMFPGLEGLDSRIRAERSSISAHTVRPTPTDPASTVRDQLGGSGLSVPVATSPPTINLFTSGTAADRVQHKARSSSLYPSSDSAKSSSIGSTLTRPMDVSSPLVNIPTPLPQDGDLEHSTEQLTTS